jgi:two-component system, NtrC family, nitrogen regulation response regulator GlnG
MQLHFSRFTEPLAVLVADDDDEMRMLVVQALRTDGCSTREAHDGDELLDLLEQGRLAPELQPDVLITDVRMPRLSGLGVLAMLQRAHWALPVVVMTAATDESIARVAMRLGAVGVLHKPFDLDDLMTAVHNARSIRDMRGPR